MSNMIPIAIPNLSELESKYVQQCMDSTFVSSVGPFVNQLEQMVAEISGTDFAVATSSGTTGLHASLIALGVEYDDLVIIPSLTFIATANAVSHSGAKPWIFDVDEESWILSSTLLEQELARQTYMDSTGQCRHKETGRAVKVIMPVCTMGLPVDLEAIRQVADLFNLKILVDAAAAIGLEINHRKLGQCEADLYVYSFNGNKTVTTGGGGAIVGQNEELMKKIKHLTTTARVGKDYEHDMVGFNYRMTNVQAAIGVAQLERLDEFLQAKKFVADTYKQHFAQNSRVELFPTSALGEGTYWLSGLKLTDFTDAEVESIIEFIQDHSIDVRKFWKPIHQQKPYLDCPTAMKNVSDKLWGKILVLPCSTHITDDELSKVIDVVNQALNQL